MLRLATITSVAVFLFSCSPASDDAVRQTQLREAQATQDQIVQNVASTLVAQRMELTPTVRPAPPVMAVTNRPSPDSSSVTLGILSDRALSRCTTTYTLSGESYFRTDSCDDGSSTTRRLHAKDVDGETRLYDYDYPHSDYVVIKASQVEFYKNDGSFQFAFEMTPGGPSSPISGPSTASSTTLGTWTDSNYPYCTITIKRSGGSYSKNERCPDGSTGTGSLSTKTVGGEARLYDEYNSYGDYMVIEGNRLAFYDNKGFIYSLTPGSTSSDSSTGGSSSSSDSSEDCDTLLNNYIDALMLFGEDGGLTQLYLSEYDENCQ